MALRDPEILRHTLRAEERSALDAFVTEVKRSFADDLERVVLFGSRARGDSREDSDIDVLVLLRRPTTWEDRRRAVAAAHAAQWRGDVFVAISPLVLSVADLEELRRRERLLAEDIDTQGIAL